MYVKVYVRMVEENMGFVICMVCLEKKEKNVEKRHMEK